MSAIAKDISKLQPALDHTHDVISQLIQQGACCEDGVIRVPSDSVCYLHFAEDNVPSWVESSPFLRRRGTLNLFELNLVNCVGLIRVGPIDLEVECTKLTPLDFRRLIHEVSLYLMRLPFSHRGSGSAYRPVYKADKCIEYHILIYVSNLLESKRLQTAVAQITANPHVLFVKEKHQVRVEQARRTDSLTVKNICALPRYFEPIRSGSSLSKRSLSRRLQGTSLENHFPGSVLSSRMISILDNPENQFVLHVLESMLDAVGRVKLSPQCTLDIHTEAGRIQEEIEYLLGHDLFREVSRPRLLNLSSQVLQRRAGYREMLTFHSEMTLPPTPAWSEDLRRLLELKDAATLYEYWVFIEICKNVEMVTGTGSAKASVVDYDPLGVSLARGIRVRFPGHIEVDYNRSFKGYSGPFRPDVTLITPSGMWVFDAKFRLDRRTKSSLETENDDLAVTDDTAKTDDIHKMHTYRDALSPKCRGAYAVYPGDELLMYPAVSCDVHLYGADTGDSGTSRKIFVAPDGVGAIPAKPGTCLSHLPAIVRKLLSLSDA
jgi:hypothetical protein